MATFKTYREIIFGRKGHKWQGVDQGYDPCGEPMGRVQYSMDCDYDAQTLSKRDGYEKHTTYGSSVINVQNCRFDDLLEGLAVQTGDGAIRYRTGI